MSLAVHLMLVFLLEYGVNDCFDDPLHHAHSMDLTRRCMLDGLHSNVDG